MKTEMQDARGIPPPEGKLPLVVCVDDEPEVLRALSRLLRCENYELRTTTDPEVALEWVRAGDVTLFIADYRMPEMSGTSLLQLVKSYSPQTVRIMLTGYPEEFIVMAAGEAGLMDLVGKPWDDEALKKIIRCRLDADETGGSA